MNSAILFSSPTLSKGFLKSSQHPTLSFSNSKCSEIQSECDLTLNFGFDFSHHLKLFPKKQGHKPPLSFFKSSKIICNSNSSTNSPPSNHGKEKKEENAPSPSSTNPSFYPRPPTPPVSPSPSSSPSLPSLPSPPLPTTNASLQKSYPTASRVGLFRTPNSGGVQSATSSHRLPPPAVAVRNLTEQAKYAHLCTVMSQMHHRRSGYPFGSLVDFATDSEGHPIFSLSQLAIHTRNLLADPRCTLVVQIPGWSGLANARVTIFGDVYPLPDEDQELAQKIYMKKHQHGASQQWGNFYFYRMEKISDIYFVGGFGTVAWVDVAEYQNSKPDQIAKNNSELTLQKLNVMFSNELCEILEHTSIDKSAKSVDDVALISIDSQGVDIRVRQGTQFNVQRMYFEDHVEGIDDAVLALRKLIDSCKG